MSKKLSNDYEELSQVNDSKWDVAIVDAKNEIERIKGRAIRLHRAIKIFEANKREGVPWPTDGVEVERLIGQTAD